MVSFKAVSLFFLAAPAIAIPVQDAASATDPYVQQINKYRAEMKPKARPALVYNSQLHANALKTVTDDNGQERHELNPGTLAQTLVPAIPDACTLDTFVYGLVQGWICEEPSLLPAGSCKSNSGYVFNGQTGHAEILSSTQYTKVGCACYKGIWGCDFA